MSNSEKHELTDIGNGKRLAEKYGHDLRHDMQSNQWYEWSGKCWTPIVAGEVMRYAKDTASAIRMELRGETEPERTKAISIHAKSAQSMRSLKAMIELAASEQPIALTSDTLDAEPFLLCAANGTIDLRTGELGPHLREHLLTQQSGADYAPDAQAPLFEGVVRNLTGGDEELAGYVQRAVGYAATASRREQAFFFLYGTGGEGKTLFLEVIADVLGTYAQHIATETLMAKRPGGISNDVVRMRGKRFGYASEIDQGQQLDEPLLKQLSGGDTVTARGLYKEHIEFTQVPKIFVATNYKPRIKGTDTGIWRRTKVIPCVNSLSAEDRDPTLAEKLKGERSGILAWIVRGCLEWQRVGLKEVAAVSQAVATYRGELDMVGRFVDELCSLAPSASVMCQELLGHYVDWCSDIGEHPLSFKDFQSDLKVRGFDTKKSTGGRYRVIGLGLNRAKNEILLATI